jgi:hypothetical protein
MTTHHVDVDAKISHVDVDANMARNSRIFAREKRRT